MSNDHTGQTTIKSRYERLTSDREQFLTRARQCAELTIPTLVPPQGRSAITKYYTPWQGIGARGVNNLASKLLITVLPPNAPFFKMSVDDFTKDKLAGDPEFKTKVDEGLGKYERAVMSDIEQSGLRAPTFLTLKYLIVSGNALYVVPPDGPARVFGLDSFVCERDPDGNVLQAISKESVSPETLDADILEAIKERNPSQNKTANTPSHDTVEIYTRYWLKGRRWMTCQEVEGVEIEGSHGSWPYDKAPFMALRWNTVEGEAYGRSYVEEYLGDLISLEGLSKAIVEAAAASSKVVFLVAPNGVTRADDIAKAESGDAIVGQEQDVSTLQVEKQGDLRVAYEAVQTITQRLSFAFMLNSSVQRNGERVTAEEIRFIARELEDALGGFYSLLSQEFQLPLVKRIIDRATKAKKLPPLPKGMVKPVIVTGLEALGRGHDAQKLIQWGTVMGQNPATAAEVNLNEFANRVAVAEGIDPMGLVRSAQQKAEAEAQQAEQMAQQQGMELAGKAAGPAIKALSDQVTNASAMQTAPQR